MVASYGPLPLRKVVPGVSSPIARPFAARITRLVDRGVPGRVALAALSFAVVASAINALT